MTFLLRNRCAARMEPSENQPYHGRCDLRAGHEGHHLLERGMDAIHWSTEPLSVSAGLRSAKELQAAIDTAQSALMGSQYVGGPSEREAWRIATEALRSVATEHRGQDPL
jgi:hypothetical protein